MIPPTSDPNTTLLLRHTFTASRERVFRAWTTPGALESWLRPRGMHMIVRSLDARAGGSFHFELSDGSSFVGTYLQFVSPKRLVYTWTSSTVPDQCTVVTLDFLEQGAATEVVLTHEGLSTAAVRALVEGGWPFLFEALAQLLSSPIF